MKNREIVVNTVVLAGGTIIGRVRLQKMIYLLSKKGLQCDFIFAYHHYGPYARSLDEAISGAKAFHNLHETLKSRVSDGAQFSIFRIDLSHQICGLETLGGIPIAQATHYIEVMISVPSTVIEIAATIYWLKSDEKIEKWHDELRLRKGAKASNSRIEQASNLLEKLSLSVA